MKSEVARGILSLAVTVVVLAGGSVASYGESNQKPASPPKATVVAVVPLCFAKMGEARNANTIKAAQNLTADLGKQKGLRVLTQQQVIDGFTQSKLSYKDVTGKSLEQLDKALPAHDVDVFLGPRPSKVGLFRVGIMRSSDFMGRSLYLDLTDQATDSAEAKRIARAAKEVASVSGKPAPKKQ